MAPRLISGYLRYDVDFISLESLDTFQKLDNIS